MRTINRAAIIVKPKRPYLEWAFSLEENPPESLEYMQPKTSVYLVGEDPERREESAPIKNYFQEIFRLELEGWDTREDLWPDTTDFRLFEHWFEVEAESVVVDLEGSKLEIEEL